MFRTRVVFWVRRARGAGVRSMTSMSGRRVSILLLGWGFLVGVTDQVVCDPNSDF